MQPRFSDRLSDIHRKASGRRGGIDELDGVISLVVSPNNKDLYAAGVRDSAVAVFSVARPEISGSEDHE